MKTVPHGIALSFLYIAVALRIQRDEHALTDAIAQLRIKEQELKGELGGLSQRANRDGQCVISKHHHLGIAYHISHPQLRTVLAPPTVIFKIIHYFWRRRWHAPSVLDERGGIQ